MVGFNGVYSNSIYGSEVYLCSSTPLFNNVILYGATPPVISILRVILSPGQANVPFFIKIFAEGDEILSIVAEPFISILQVGLAIFLARTVYMPATLFSHVNIPFSPTFQSSTTTGVPFLNNKYSVSASELLNVTFILVTVVPSQYLPSPETSYIAGSGTI